MAEEKDPHMPTGDPTSAEAMKSAWFLYVLRCADDSLYTGITTDLERRVAEHNNGPKGARYTRARRPVVLVTSWPHADQSAATKAERLFKALPRKAKLAVISRERPAPWAR